MKTFFSIVSLVISFSVFSQDKDSLQIVQLLKNDYATLGNWDLHKHLKNVTPGYILIENGPILNINDEKEYFNKNSKRLINRKDSFKFNTIRISGDMAYAVYNLRSDILENGKIKGYNWNESAIFRKIKGEWKIELIHSTRFQEEN